MGVNGSDLVEQGLERPARFEFPRRIQAGGPIIELRLTAGNGHQPPVKRGILPQTRFLSGALPAT
jgi:hypothetical protein